MAGPRSPWSTKEKEALLAYVKDRNGYAYASVPVGAEKSFWEGLEAHRQSNGFGTARTTGAIREELAREQVLLQSIFRLKRRKRSSASSRSERVRGLEPSGALFEDLEAGVGGAWDCLGF